jgi:hypothetical protein
MCHNTRLSGSTEDFTFKKIFVNISAVFGSEAAPSQFYVFAATVKFLAQFLCLVPVCF